jgi:hypothetical protein
MGRGDKGGCVLGPVQVIPQAAKSFLRSIELVRDPFENIGFDYLPATGLAHLLQQAAS